jgi:hypothetical protein
VIAVKPVYPPVGKVEFLEVPIDSWQIRQGKAQAMIFNGPNNHNVWPKITAKLPIRNQPNESYIEMANSRESVRPIKAHTESLTSPLQGRAPFKNTGEENNVKLTRSGSAPVAPLITKFQLYHLS